VIADIISLYIQSSTQITAPHALRELPNLPECPTRVTRNSILIFLEFLIDHVRFPPEQTKSTSLLGSSSRHTVDNLEFRLMAWYFWTSADSSLSLMGFWLTYIDNVWSNESSCQSRLRNRQILKPTSLLGVWCRTKLRPQNKGTNWD